MSEKITVLLVEPKKEPCLIEVENSNEALIDLLEGELDEYTPFADDIALVCAVDGKQKNKEPNRKIIADENEIQDTIFGKFLVCYAPIDSEKYISLPDDLVEKYTEIFRNPE